MVTLIVSTVLLAGSQVAADDVARMETLVEWMLERIGQLEERVEALEAENAQLRERLAQLEAGANEQVESEDEVGPNRVMQITRIEVMPIDQEKIRQAEELEKQAAVHEKRAAEYEKQRSRIPEGTTVLMQKRIVEIGTTCLISRGTNAMKRLGWPAKRNDCGAKRPMCGRSSTAGTASAW